MNQTPSPKDFAKISPTALAVAYLRQFTDIPYTAAIAQQIEAEAILAQFDIHPSRAGLFTFTVLIEGRYKATDCALTQQSSPQILELASGLLPRGMVMTQQSNLHFVESDLPDMIERKQRLVQHLVGDRPNLHFASVDVTTPFTISVLAADRPLTIICEGLLQYLTFAEKEQVFAHARALLQKHGGAWITPDLSTKQRRAVFRETAPEILQLLQSVDNLTGRSFSHNSFDDLEHVKRFVAEQGLNLEIMSMANVFDQLTCLDRLNINKTIAEKLLAASYVFVMTI